MTSIQGRNLRAVVNPYTDTKLLRANFRVAFYSLGVESGSDGLRKRYPTHGSVNMYSGRAGSFSIFLRSILTYDLRYSSSPPYSGPQTVRKSLACVKGAPWFFMSSARRSNSVGER